MSPDCRVLARGIFDLYDQMGGIQENLALASARGLSIGLVNLQLNGVEAKALIMKGQKLITDEQYDSVHAMTEDIRGALPKPATEWSDHLPAQNFDIKPLQLAKQAREKISDLMFDTVVHCECERE